MASVRTWVLIVVTTESSQSQLAMWTASKNKKLSYCLETARRESLPRIAEILWTYSFCDTGRGNDNLDWNDLQMSFSAYAHLYLTLNLKVMPSEYGDEIWRQKTRIMGLLYGEEMIAGWTTWASARVWQTDRQIYDDYERTMHETGWPQD